MGARIQLSPAAWLRQTAAMEDKVRLRVHGIGVIDGAEPLARYRQTNAATLGSQPAVGLL